MFFYSKIKLHSETAADALEDSLSPLLKLVKMHNFIRQATAANVVKCLATGKFMPCCRITLKKLDLISLIPGKWLTDNVSFAL